MFIAALFTIAKLWKQPRCPTTDEWIKKMWYVYVMEFYAATKKNEMLSHLNSSFYFKPFKITVRRRTKVERRKPIGIRIHIYMEISQ
jgi:hypothetical protein